MSVAQTTFVRIPPESLMAGSANAAVVSDREVSLQHAGMGAAMCMCGVVLIYLFLSRGARTNRDNENMNRYVRSPTFAAPRSIGLSPRRQAQSGPNEKPHRRIVTARRQSKITDFLNTNDLVMPEQRLRFTSPDVDVKRYTAASDETSPWDHDQIMTLAPSLQECNSLRSSPSPRLFFGREALYEPSPNKSNETSSQAGSPQSVILGLDGTKTLLVLMLKDCLDSAHARQQADALALLKGRQVDYEVVDGMDPTKRNLRLHLQEISGKRDEYPQFFFLHGDDSITYVGSWRDIQSIHHAEGLPRAYRDGYPAVVTWDEMFGDRSQMFSV